MFDEVPERLATIRARMAAAALRAGRNVDEVTLVAVSKTFPIEAVRAAYAAGQRDFGENRLQEALQKMTDGADMEIRWHLIGHLQSNKARKAAAAVHAIHVVDSVELLQKLDEGAVAAGRQLEALVQVDLAGEPTKHGATADLVPAIMTAASGCRAVAVTGLMLLPPLVDDPEAARPWFRQLRELRDRLQNAGVPAHHVRHLSMGMSHDFGVAIEEGATIVRVGSAIFGGRA